MLYVKLSTVFFKSYALFCAHSSFRNTNKSFVCMIFFFFFSPCHLPALYSSAKASVKKEKNISCFVVCVSCSLENLQSRLGLFSAEGQNMTVKSVDYPE